jgi:hypothetical protein
MIVNPIIWIFASSGEPPSSWKIPPVFFPGSPGSAPRFGHLADLDVPAGYPLRRGRGGGAETEDGEQVDRYGAQRLVHALLGAQRPQRGVGEQDDDEPQEPLQLGGAGESVEAAEQVDGIPVARDKRRDDVQRDENGDTDTDRPDLGAARNVRACGS